MEVKPSAVEPDAPIGMPTVRDGLIGLRSNGCCRRFDADEERAAQQYERLRQRAHHLLLGPALPGPEVSGDETLDRISRRIEEGEQIRDVDPLCLRSGAPGRDETFKSVRRRHRLLTSLATSTLSPAGVTSQEHSGRTPSSGIQGCMRRLPPEDRELISHYYESGGRDQQEERRQLAARLGLSAVALRLRAFRIRRVLPDMHGGLPGQQRFDPRLLPAGQSAQAVRFDLGLEIGGERGHAQVPPAVAASSPPCMSGAPCESGRLGGRSATAERPSRAASCRRSSCWSRPPLS